MMDCTTAFAVPGSDTIIDCINPETGRSWIYGKTLEDVRKEYPGAQIVNIEDHCAAKAKRQDTPIEWSETNEERYMEMLEVLPPAAWIKGGFLVGEPCDHHALNGQPRFQCYLHKGDKYLSASRPITRKEFIALFADVSASAAAEIS